MTDVLTANALMASSNAVNSKSPKKGLEAVVKVLMDEQAEKSKSPLKGPNPVLIVRALPREILGNDAVIVIVALPSRDVDAKRAIAQGKEQAETPDAQVKRIEAENQKRLEQAQRIQDQNQELFRRSVVILGP